MSGQAVATSMHELRQRAEGLASTGRRRLLGISGAPGSGKSTLASSVRAALGDRAVVVPMDGFHLSNEILTDLDLTDRKGAPETFDASGFRSLLRRLRDAVDPVVYAPAFRREIEQTVNCAIPVTASTPLAIVEGNYLLLDEGPWHGIRELFDETWFLTVDPAVRQRRLTDRHERHGRSAHEAARWVARNDEPNTRVAERTSSLADVLVRIEDTTV